MAKGKSRNTDWLRAHIAHVSDDCLTWPFGYDSDGYGRTKFDGRIQFAARVMCILAHGEPPTPSHMAAHNCGNGDKGCVNPRHIEWKTWSENQLDRARHGTQSTGCRTHLTQEIVDAMRSFKGKMPQREIALMFGTSRSNVTSILNGKTWPAERRRRSVRAV